METAPETSQNPAPPRRWQPISSIDRRVLGVLFEKAKTTPDIYPMTVSAICTGCNQKNNRWPLMELDKEEVEESLDRLRGIGAVGMVEGYGRVQKYRHYLYEWLGVDKVESAVMTELLLRGDQTVGDLRGRAARMEPIADLAALRPILDSLKAKGLVISLTPEGRGQVVTHALLKPRELEAVQAKYHGDAARSAAVEEESEEELERQTPRQPQPPAPRTAAPASRPPVPSGDPVSVMMALRRELDDLRNQIAQLQSDFDEVRTSQHGLADEVRALKEALGG